MRKTPKYRAPAAHDDPAIQRIRSKRGMLVQVANACGRSRQAVSQWTRVPVECVPVVAQLLEMDPADVRPDLPQLFGRRT